MAEAIGLVASVATLIKLTETVKKNSVQIREDYQWGGENIEPRFGKSLQLAYHSRNSPQAIRHPAR